MTQTATPLPIALQAAKVIAAAVSAGIDPTGFASVTNYLATSKWTGKIPLESDRYTVPVLHTPGTLRALNGDDPVHGGGNDGIEFAEDANHYWGKKGTPFVLPASMLMGSQIYNAGVISGGFLNNYTASGILLGSLYATFPVNNRFLVGQLVKHLPIASYVFLPGIITGSFYPSVTIDPNFTGGDCLVIYYPVLDGFYPESSAGASAAPDPAYVASDWAAIARVLPRWNKLRYVLFGSPFDTSTYGNAETMALQGQLAGVDAIYGGSFDYTAGFAPLLGAIEAAAEEFFDL